MQRSPSATPRTQHLSTRSALLALGLVLSQCATAPRNTIIAPIATAAPTTSPEPLPTTSFQLHLDNNQARALQECLGRMTFVSIAEWREEYQRLKSELELYLAHQPQETSRDITQNTILDGSESGTTNIIVRTSQSDATNQFRSTINVSREGLETIRTFLMGYISSNLRAIPSEGVRRSMAGWHLAGCYTRQSDGEVSVREFNDRDTPEMNCFATDIYPPETFPQYLSQQRASYLNLLITLTDLVATPNNTSTNILLHIADAIRLVASQHDVVLTTSNTNQFSPERLATILNDIEQATTAAREATVAEAAQHRETHATIATTATWNAASLSINEIGTLKTMLIAFVTGNSVGGVTVPAYNMPESATAIRSERDRHTLPGYWSLNARHRLHILYAIATLQRLENFRMLHPQ